MPPQASDPHRWLTLPVLAGAQFAYLMDVLLVFNKPFSRSATRLASRR
ncbi:MAG: hypothetical protein ABL951_04910 [Alphaproteobacteria bacterium]